MRDKVIEFCLCPMLYMYDLYIGFWDSAIMVSALLPNFVEIAALFHPLDSSQNCCWITYYFSYMQCNTNFQKNKWGNFNNSNNASVKDPSCIGRKCWSSIDIFFFFLKGKVSANLIWLFEVLMPSHSLLMTVGEQCAPQDHALSIFLCHPLVRAETNTSQHFIFSVVHQLWICSRVKNTEVVWNWLPLISVAVRE